VRLGAAGQEHFFAVRQVNAILLTKGTAMSTDAALLAVEHGIPVLLLDAQTHYPLAQVSSGQPGNIVTVRKNQPAFSRSAAGFRWVADTIAEKIVRQRAYLQYLSEQPSAPTGFAADVALAAQIMSAQERALRQWSPPSPWNIPEADTVAGRFRGQEGTASRLYFQQIARYLHGKFDFENRQKRPAYDPFNALLNYLYGMLYTSVHLGLLKSGIDPYLGVLHADRYGATATLVFDAIEPYRPWADRVAIELTESGQAGPEAFEPDPDEHGLWLSSAGKSAVIDAMLAFLEESAAYNGRQVKRKVQIDLDAQQLAVLIKGISADGDL
jgi:CRISPR-associated protein Cas1